MDDLFQMTGFVFSGVTSFPKPFPNNELKAGGKVFYHFLNEGEDDKEKVNPFVQQFKLETQEVIPYNKADLDKIINKFDYTPTETVEIVPFNRMKFAKFDNDCLAKYTFEFESGGRTYYAIMVINVKQKKKASTIKFTLAVHVYLNKEIQQQKFNEISDNVYKMQFSNL